MASKKNYTALGAAAGMLMLILDGKTALAGAQVGIDLCIRTVIPALFPFFVLSSMLVTGIDGRWLQPLGKLCRIPKGAEPLLIVGFLGGYPTGAQCVTQAYRNGQLSKSQAERMLAFCSNAGPSFLFGMVAQMFDHQRYIWLLWGIHIASAIIVARLIPARDLTPASVSVTRIRLPQALAKAVSTISLVCGWVILFRILITFLDRWVLWLLPDAVQVILVGLLELSNGCCALGSIQNTALRFLVCSGLLAFGGICVTMQSRSVTAGLSLKPYLFGKLLQTGISLILAYAVQFLFPNPIPGFWYLILLTLPIFFRLRKKEINSSIPQSIGV